MLDSFQARPKLSKCHVYGRRHGLVKISWSDLNELTTAHSSGKTTITPQTATNP